MYWDTNTGAIILLIVASIAAAMIALRSIVLWWLKIDERLSAMKRNNELLEQLITLHGAQPVSQQDPHIVKVGAPKK